MKRRGPEMDSWPASVGAWEEATVPAQAAGIRVVSCRFGIVLSPRGGALGVMLPIFQAGLGGKLGNGEQLWSWIALPNVTHAMMHVTAHAELAGPVNFTTPNAVTNAEFTRVLGHVLRRPTIFTAPAFANAARSGRDGRRDAAERRSCAAAQARASGYAFKHAELEEALRALLRRPARAAD